MPSSRRTMLFFLTLLVIAASYVPVLPASFVADDYTIYSPEFLSRPWRYFYQSLWGGQDVPETYLRPLGVLTFACDNLLRSGGTFVPHLTNLLLHLAVTSVVGLLILRGGAGGEPSCRWAGVVPGMLLLGLHPQAVEAVAFVSGRWEVLAALFGMLGLYAWIQLHEASRATGIRWRSAALACFTAALLSKETAVLFVAAAFLWSLGRFLKVPGERGTRDWLSPVLLVVLSLLYLYWRRAVLGHIGAGLPPLVFGGLLLLAQAGVLVWPFTGTAGVPSLPLYAVLLLAAGGLLAWSLSFPSSGQKRGRIPWTLPLLLLGLNLAMFSRAPGWVVAESPRMTLEGAESRYSYTGLCALAVLVGWTFTILTSRAQRRAVAILVCGLIFAFIWPQQFRVSCWRTMGHRVESFLLQTIALAPEPGEGSVLVFKGLPLTVASMGHAYFFGLGLREAIALRYRRSDLVVNRFPNREILEHPPDNAYVFVYSFKEGTLRLVHKPVSARAGVGDSGCSPERGEAV